ncbi:MAG: hypothetical protein GXO31_03675 [Epsilonproteobacteria bacterium]|nr:hypothetical protein [Campylobacterota bacterium]
MAQNVTIYEDAEDGSIKGWEIYDKNPPGAVIRNVYDSERKSRVIEFQGHGIDNGYWLRKDNLAYWDNRTQFILEWSMKFAETYIIYVYLYTNKGFKYLQYEPRDDNPLGSGNYIKIGLGSSTKDGKWHTIRRDLREDIHLAQKDTQIIAVEAFLVRGNGRVDDIKLMRDSISPAPPLAPSDLEAVSSSLSVTLSWKDNSDNESGFNVYRDGVLIHTTAMNKTFYTDEGLSPDTAYSYEVRAFNSYGESEGVRISVKTEPQTTVTVYEDAEDGSIAGWAIYDRYPPGATIKNVFDNDKNSRVIELKGHGVGNGFWLRNSDFSYWDNKKQFIAKWSMKFAENYIIYFYILTTKGYKYLQYEPRNDDLLGSGNYIRYGLGEGTKDGKWHTIERDLREDLKNAQSDTDIIAVEAFLVRGSGRVDDIMLLSKDVTPPQKPAAPSDLKAEVETRSITLSWRDNSDNESGFNIYRDGVLIFSTTPNVTSYTDTGLTPSTSYTYSVTAVNDAGESESISITVVTKESEGGETVTVYEDAEDGNIEGWSVYDDTPSGAVIRNVYDSDKKSRVIELKGHGIDNGYWLRNGDGSYWSNRKQFIIEWSMKYSENFIVYILLTTDKGTRYLRYDPVDSDALGSGTYIKYGIGSSTKDGKWHTIRRDLREDLKKAQPDTKLIEVEAFLIRGNGRVDDIKLIGEKEPDFPPAKPTDLKASVTKNSVSLTWKDNAQSESGYKIYRDGVLIFTTAANITSYKDENLSPDTKYRYAVRAYNDVGESEEASIEVTTMPDDSKAYYVSPQGDDSWDGKADTYKGGNHGPWKTIQHAASVVKAGETVYVREGTYVGPIRIQRSGSANEGYITFRNYPGEKPVITRRDQNMSVDTFYGIGVSYIKIIGFHIYQGVRAGIKFYGPGSHIEIRNNEVSELNANIPVEKRLEHAICITAYKDRPMSHIVIDSNHVHHNHTGNPNVGGAYDEAMTVLGAVEYFRVTNNIVHDNDFIGLDIIGHQRGSFSVFGMNRHGLVAGNICYRNGVLKEWASSLYVDGAEYLIVENNLVYDNFGLGLTISQETRESTADHVIVRNNFSWNNKRGGMLGSSHGGEVRDCVFVHNTVGGAKVETEFFLGTARNWRIKNNIFYEFGTSPYLFKDISNMTSSWEFDYNYYAPRLGFYKIHMAGRVYSDFGSYQRGTGKDPHSINGEDPKLKDPSHQDYSLRDDSPCKNAGGFFTKTVSSGSGTVIRVLDARYFTDGFGVKEGDKIKIGRNPSVRVIAVDYASNTITIDTPVSWGANEGVSYDYEGSMPDIGALKG